jgi:hypothetical protein
MIFVTFTSGECDVTAGKESLELEVEPSGMYKCDGIKLPPPWFEHS